MTVLVRAPELADVDDLARINVDTWRMAYAGILPAAYLARLDPAAYRARWVDTASGKRPGVTALVAERDGVVASYAIGGSYRRQHDEDPDEPVDDWGELYALYTDPTQQGRGCGGAVHDAMLVLMGEAGCHQAVLWVLEANAASRSWYAARGWSPDGAVTDFEAGGVFAREIRLRYRLPLAVDPDDPHTPSPPTRQFWPRFGGVSGHD